jgi:DNA-binding MarR family transcriptional regulator
MSSNTMTKGLTWNELDTDTVAVTTRRDERDRLDDMLLVWAREIPNLDPLTEGIVERIQFLAKRFNQSMDATLEAYGLEHRAFQLLGKLRSVGPPYRRTPGQLADGMHLSGGAMTNRLDRMEEAGLIRRLPDPSDRRGTLIEPTEAGHAAWDQAVGTQAEREALIAGTLTEREREELHRLLRRLMRAFPAKEHWSAPAAEAAPATSSGRAGDHPTAQPMEVASPLNRRPTRT